MKKMVRRSILLGLALGLGIVFVLVVLEGAGLAHMTGSHTREVLGIPVMRSSKTSLGTDGSTAELTPLPGLALVAAFPVIFLLAINGLARHFRQRRQGIQQHRDAS